MDRSPDIDQQPNGHGSRSDRHRAADRDPRSDKNSGAELDPDYCRDQPDAWSFQHAGTPADLEAHSGSFRHRAAEALHAKGARLAILLEEALLVEAALILRGFQGHRQQPLTNPVQQDGRIRI